MIACRCALVLLGPGWLHTPAEKAKVLVAESVMKHTEAEEALRAGDLAGYQRLNNEARQKMEEALTLLEQE